MDQRYSISRLPEQAESISTDYQFANAIVVTDDDHQFASALIPTDCDYQFANVAVTEGPAMITEQERALPSAISSGIYQRDFVHPHLYNQTISSKQVPKKTKTTWKKPKDMPKRALSAYNIFFQLERERLVSGGEEREFTAEEASKVALNAHQNPDANKRRHRKSHGKIGFADLARTIASKWNSMDSQAKTVFQECAAIEKKRYIREMEEWTKKKKEEKKDKPKSATPTEEDPAESAKDSFTTGMHEAPLLNERLNLSDVYQKRMLGVVEKPHIAPLPARRQSILREDPRGTDITHQVPVGVMERASQNILGGNLPQPYLETPLRGTTPCEIMLPTYAWITAASRATNSGLDISASSAGTVSDSPYQVTLLRHQRSRMTHRMIKDMILSGVVDGVTTGFPMAVAGQTADASEVSRIQRHSINFAVEEPPPHGAMLRIEPYQAQHGMQLNETTTINQQNDISFSSHLPSASTSDEEERELSLLLASYEERDEEC